MNPQPVVQRISECFIKLSLAPNDSNNPICYLYPFDLLMLSSQYIQRGLLFLKPSPHNNDPLFMESLLQRLKHSLSLTLLHFYPLTGGFVTTPPPSYSVFVDCGKGDGVRFIHATIDMSVSDILSPVDVPSVIQSFFDHHMAVNHDGHTSPLLSVQVTELIDGVFIGCSMNHSLADGTSFWKFFNAWSQIFQAQEGNDCKHVNEDVCIPMISNPPIYKRLFLEGCDPLITLPFKHHINRVESPPLRVRIFHFTSDSIANLKSRANKESNTTNISSFQSLSALVWRCITRARSLPRHQTTTCGLAADNRKRMEPPLREEYFGNTISVLATETSSGELLENDLGWAGLKIHAAVVNFDDKAAREFGKESLESLKVIQSGRVKHPYRVVVAGSPTFDMYGNEFGIGKALGVRSWYANKFDGNVTSSPGREGGSIDLEMCLPLAGDDDGA